MIFFIFVFVCLFLRQSFGQLYSTPVNKHYLDNVKQNALKTLLLANFSLKDAFYSIEFLKITANSQVTSSCDYIHSLIRSTSSAMDYYYGIEVSKACQCTNIVSEEMIDRIDVRYLIFFVFFSCNILSYRIIIYHHLLGKH